MVSRETAAERTALDQRRAELRLALKVRQQEVQGQELSFENVSANRHLSAQERADLRQQLRPAHRDANQEHP